MDSAGGRQVIQQRVHGYEPPVLPAQSFHQDRETLIQPAVFDKAVAKVRVHDAGAALSFELVLAILGYAVDKLAAGATL